MFRPNAFRWSQLQNTSALVLLPSDVSVGLEGPPKTSPVGPHLWAPVGIARCDHPFFADYSNRLLVGATPECSDCTAAPLGARSAPLRRGSERVAAESVVGTPDQDVCKVPVPR